MFFCVPVILEDGMNKWTSYIPHYLEKTKENQGTERLTSKINGCIIYSGHYEHNRKCMFYINHDQVSNTISFCSVVIGIVVLGMAFWTPPSKYTNSSTFLIHAT